MDSPHRAAYGGLLLAISLTAVLQSVLVLRSPTVSADGIIFIGIARDLSERPAQCLSQHDQHPGYPAMLLGATRLVQALGYRADPEAWMLGAQAVTFICGLLSVWVVWLFARDLFDTRVANFAAFMFAVLPIPRANAADAQSDTPHLLFYLMAAWLASIAITRGRLWLLAAAGLSSGIAYLIRPEGLEVALITVPCLLVHGWRACWPWSRIARTCGAVAGMAIVVAAPYWLLAGKITSKQVPFASTRTAPSFIAQQAEAESQMASSPQPVGQPSESVAVSTHRRFSAALVLRLAAEGCARLLVSLGQGLKFAFVPFYFISLRELVRRKPDWVPVVLLTVLAVAHMVILVGVYVMSGYIAHRHVIPLVAVGMPYTALGAVYAGDLLARRVRWPKPIVSLVPLTLAALLVLPYSLRPFNREFVPVIEATLWVKSHAAPKSGVICNSPYVEFYGAMPTAMLGPDALTIEASLAKFSDEASFDFVILHVNAHDYRPEWIAQVEPFYTPVREIIDPAEYPRPKKVVVFQAKAGQARRATRGSHS